MGLVEITPTADINEAGGASPMQTKATTMSAILWTKPSTRWRENDSPIRADQTNRRYFGQPRRIYYLFQVLADMMSGR